MKADMFSMLINMSATFPTLYVTLAFISVLLGVFIIGSSLLQWYHESHHDGGRMTAGVLMMQCFIGTVMTMPLFVMTVIRNSILPGYSTASGPFMYADAGASSQQQVIVNAFYLFFGVVGFIAFIRGWLLANKHVKGEVQDAAWSAFWHIVGGVFLIYLDIGMRFITDWTGFDFVDLILF